MDKKCEIIKDLLPLYADGICSEASRELVEEHIATCPDCSVLLDKMKKEDFVDELKSEKTTVIENQSRRFRRRTFTAGAVIAGILMIPVMVCLIVNLASGHALDWFFIVLSALLVAASLTAVPLIVPRRRFLWTVGSFTASLVLLLGVCCLYTKGGWFFVASSACLFGLATALLPIVLNCEPLKSALVSHKSLIYIVICTILFYIMMLFIGVNVKVPGYFRLMFAISLPLIAFVWVLFLTARYVRSRRLIRAGLCTVETGVFFFFVENIIGAGLGSPMPLPEFHPFVWNISTVDENLTWLVSLGITAIGAILIIFGLIFKTKKEKQK